jgi:hypothetical protein
MDDFCVRNASARHGLFPVGAVPSPRRALPAMASSPLERCPRRECPLNSGEALRGEGAAPTGSNILVLARMRYRAEPAFMLHDLT